MNTAKQHVLESMIRHLAIVAKSPDPAVQAEAANLSAELNRKLAKLLSEKVAAQEEPQAA